MSDSSEKEEMEESYKNAALLASVDPDEAMAVALSLVERGFAEAGFLIGAILEVKGDFDSARRYYEIAFSRADLVLACIGLARLNFLGRCSDASVDKAYQYYMYLHENSNHPMAKMMLGRMYMEGISVDKDLKKAEGLLLEASREGYVFSYSNLAQLYWKRRLYVKAILMGLRGWYLYIRRDKTSLSSSYI